MRTPWSDYVETSGVIFFARMLEKIRLKNAGELPPDYNFVGNGVWDSFDARFCRFFDVDEAALTKRALEGGTNEEILEWCFQKFGRPNEEKIRAWNSYLAKRGWSDESSEELEQVKSAHGFGARGDIQTWIDFHDADEGRTPRSKVRIS